MSKSDVFISASLKRFTRGYACYRPRRSRACGKIAALMDKPVKLAAHREFTTGAQSWTVKR